MQIVCILWPIYEKLVFIFSLVIHMSALWWGLTALKFSFSWVWRTPSPPPPNLIFFLHILGLNFKISYQIASLFYMHTDMGERIAGKQDRSSLIIEHPLRAPQIAPNIHIIFYILAHIYEKLVFKLFPLLYICLHCDEIGMLTFRCPCYRWILCKGPTWPKGSCQIASIFDMTLCKLLLKRW